MYGTEYETHSFNPFKKNLNEHDAPCAVCSSSHVAQCLWCPHGMIVHLAGPRSIMGTWWPDTTGTRKDMTSSVLTRMQSMFPVVRPTTMVPYSILWKEYVAHSRATRMSPEESWHALCAPSDRRPPSSVFHWKPERRNMWFHFISKGPVINMTYYKTEKLEF